MSQDKTEETPKRLYYINVAGAVKAFDKKDENRNCSSGMYIAGTDLDAAERTAIASAAAAIVNDPPGTLILSVVGSHEISKEMADSLTADFAHARPQAEIDADEPKGQQED